MKCLVDKGNKVALPPPKVRYLISVAPCTLSHYPDTERRGRAMYKVDRGNTPFSFCKSEIFDISCLQASSTFFRRRSGECKPNWGHISGSKTFHFIKACFVSCDHQSFNMIHNIFKTSLSDIKLILSPLFRRSIPDCWILSKQPD